MSGKAKGGKAKGGKAKGEKAQRGRPKIYTRRGDTGETGLIGAARVAKDDPRVEAYGEVDELNAVLGSVIAADPAHDLDPERLHLIQEDLFVIGARLATADPDRARRRGAIPELPPERIGELEAWIDEMDEELVPLTAFILPGGSPLAARLQVARTVCRRAERAIIGLLPSQPDLGEVVVPYMNRLSDLLFTLARYANHLAGVEDTIWAPRRKGGDEA